MHFGTNYYNPQPHPFQWVAIASQILRKVRKYRGILKTGDKSEK